MNVPVVQGGSEDRKMVFFNNDGFYIISTYVELIVRTRFDECLCYDYYFDFYDVPYDIPFYSTCVYLLVYEDDCINIRRSPRSGYKHYRVINELLSMCLFCYSNESIFFEILQKYRVVLRDSVFDNIKLRNECIIIRK